MEGGLNAALRGEKRIYALIIAFSLLEALTHFGNANPIRGNPDLDFDSPYYIRMLYYLRGEVERPPAPPFHMRPLIPALALPLSYLVGVNNAFGLVNTTLWVLTALALYRLTLRLFMDREVALLSAILFSSSVPVLVYGAAISTDMAGLLFIIAGVILALRVKDLRGYIAEGALIGMGVLAREPVSILIPMIPLMRVLRGETRFKRLAVELLVVLAVSSTPPAIYWFIIPNPNYTARFASCLATAFTSEKLIKSLIQVALTYHVGYLYLAYCLVKRGLSFDRAVHAILIVTIGFLVVDYFVGIPASRFVFLTAPAVLPMIAIGARELAHSLTSDLRLKRAALLAFIALYAAISNIGTADKNLCFPSLSDEPIKQLMPEEVRL